ncbi:glutathione S-transferase family protein [Duganella qianjiadongensis]|uniref:Glutathione S-transferase n=1 Tax=Duganella qianjiadongensis TaxID=2692176 RepID=A0ABW9VK25_9BURK|nr:glutathione S-transferase [Duganella qianjiadongensis]MYM39949.1 glutathione S-transferase [Duganella qianjiadongensis]
MLKILGKTSSINVRKVLWTCAELGLAYEQEDWGSGFRATDTPEFLALNPNAMVPVIVDGPTTLWESNTICRYLAGKHGRSDLLPAEPAARALVEQWMDWQAGELNNSWRYAFMALVRQSPQHTDGAAIAASISNWNRHMGILERQLERTGSYVTGQQFTLADVVLGLSANRWSSTPMERPDYPAVAAYLERLAQRPGDGFARHCRNGLA